MTKIHFLAKYDNHKDQAQPSKRSCTRLKDDYGTLTHYQKFSTTVMLCNFQTFQLTFLVLEKSYFCLK